jgi:hypothetical protein
VPDLAETHDTFAKARDSESIAMGGAKRRPEMSNSNFNMPTQVMSVSPGVVLIEEGKVSQGK